jgi:FkbM family methyltransferase
MSTNKPQVVSQQMIEAISRAIQGQAEETLVNRQRIAALEARQQVVEQGRKPRGRIEFRSQFGEDLWIWDVLGWQTEGFFIEVGAFDGYHYSVTYGLEMAGWNGLLIEALPGPFEKCRQRRPNSRVVNAALGRRGASGTTKFVSVQDQYGGMLSYAEAKSDHARTISENKFRTSTIEAQLTSMDELLKDHSGPIDAAVIDVEGAELDVLDGFNLDKHKPRVLILEDNQMGKNPALGNYMATKPYIFAGWLAVNRLYVRADEEKMLERLKRY